MPIMIECTKLGEKFAVPFYDGYSKEAQSNAVLVGLARIVNDSVAGIVRANYPTGQAGTDAWREVCRQKVNIRLANLANADKKAESDPLAGLSPEERAAVMAIRAKKSAA